MNFIKVCSLGRENTETQRNCQRITIFGSIWEDSKIKHKSLERLFLMAVEVDKLGADHTNKTQGLFQLRAQVESIIFKERILFKVNAVPFVLSPWLR